MGSFKAADGGGILVAGAARKEDNGYWRHAEFGGWHRYEGSAYSMGPRASTELEAALNAFAKTIRGKHLNEIADIIENNEENTG